MFICVYMFLFVNAQIIAFNVWIIRQSFRARTHIRFIAWAGGWWVWPALGTAMGMVVRWSLFFLVPSKTVALSDVLWSNRTLMWFLWDRTSRKRFWVWGWIKTSPEIFSGWRSKNPSDFGRRVRLGLPHPSDQFYCSIPHSHAADLGCRPFLDTQIETHVSDVVSRFSPISPGVHFCIS